MKDVSLHPVQATVDTINKALLDPKNSEDLLVGFSEYFELNSMLYKRLLHYLSDMLSWNVQYVCTNIRDDKEYLSPAYKKDYAKMVDFFYHMDIKNEFRTALRQMIRRETYYTYFRNDANRYVFQELPREFARITAKWEYGLVFDFSMLWFIQPGVDIEFYPPIFKKYYNDIFKNGRPNSIYDPATSIDNRTSSWVYYHQTSPEDGFWPFKLSSEIIANVPLYAPLFPDLVNQPIIRQLQNNSYIAMASKMVTSEVPYLNDKAKGPVKGDNISITPETLGRFLSILRAGINQVISVAALPTTNISALEFSGNTEIYDLYNKNTAALSGVNSKLIYSFERQNVLETALSTNTDENFIKPVYSQFEDFLNYQINYGQNATSKYKFKITLHGTNFSNAKKAELDTATGLANMGMVLPQRFACALDMMPWDFDKQLTEARMRKFVDKLTPIVSAFNQSSDQQKNGRPQKSVGDLASDDTQSAGTNLEKESDD